MLKLNNLRATESWSFTQGITYLAYNSQTVYAWVIFNLYIEKSDGRITHWEIFYTISGFLHNWCEFM